MPGEQETLPLDARLLSDAVIELNISRRNVAVYPKGHPSVERCLDRAFDLLRKLFELRPEIKLAVAKSTLIVDDSYLDRKNPVYREFGHTLSSLSIACVSFLQGLRRDELYAFLKILCLTPSEDVRQDIDRCLAEQRIPHIQLQFVDYDAFAFREHGAEQVQEEEGEGQRLWERYIYGLLNDALVAEETSEAVRRIDPRLLAAFLEGDGRGLLKDDSYDRVITNYMHRTSARAFTPGDLKKILEFINALKPELKKQFLQSAAKNVASDPVAAERALAGVSADEVLELLTVINEQRVAIPEGLSNLLSTFSARETFSFPEQTSGDGLVVDDVFLSSSVLDLLDGDSFQDFVSDTYQKEIQKILDSDASKYLEVLPAEQLAECSDEFLERCHARITLELFLAGVVDKDDCEAYLDTLRGVAPALLYTGQYLEVVRMLTVLTRPGIEEQLSDRGRKQVQYFFSPNFLDTVVSSFQLVGRLMREEALALCDYFGEPIVTPILSALIEERHPAVRRFLMELVTQFGDRAVPDVLKRLKDRRWFVLRNMVFLLGELGNEECAEQIRPLCRHENRKVLYEAVRALLKLGDPYGIGMTRRLIRSTVDEDRRQGVIMSGAFELKDMVPELVNLLEAPGRAEIEQKIAVIRALGDIGDPSALPALRRIVASRGFPFRSEGDRLKDEVCLSLKQYPFGAIRSLVEVGLKSRNETVRAECARLAAKGAPGVTAGETDRG